MSRGVNKVIVLGYLGADPEIKTLPSGDLVANFSMATSESWRDKKTQEIKERTEWHNVTMYGRTVETTIQKYVQKGTLAYVEGALRSSKWQDKNGVERTKVEIVANLFRLVGSRSQSSQGVGGSPMTTNETSNNTTSSYSPTTSALSTTDLDDEIPF